MSSPTFSLGGSVEGRWQGQDPRLGRLWGEFDPETRAVNNLNEQFWRVLLGSILYSPFDLYVILGPFSLEMK